MATNINKRRPDSVGTILLSIDDASDETKKKIINLFERQQKVINDLSKDVWRLHDDLRTRGLEDAETIHRLEQDCGMYEEIVRENNNIIRDLKTDLTQTTLDRDHLEKLWTDQLNLIGKKNKMIKNLDKKLVEQRNDILKLEEIRDKNKWIVSKIEAVDYWVYEPIRQQINSSPLFELVRYVPTPISRLYLSVEGSLFIHWIIYALFVAFNVNSNFVQAYNTNHSFFIFVILINVIYEEMLKKMSITCANVLVFGELAMYLWMGTSVLMRIPALCLHFVTARIKLEYAIVLHFFFNYLVFIRQIELGLVGSSAQMSGLALGSALILAKSALDTGMKLEKKTKKKISQVKYNKEHFSSFAMDKHELTLYPTPKKNLGILIKLPKYKEWTQVRVRESLDSQFFYWKKFSGIETQATVILMNSAAETLYNMTELPSYSAYNTLVEKCRLIVHRIHVASEVEKKHSDRQDKLLVGDEVVTDVKLFMKKENIFKKDKPIFKAILKKLEQHEDVGSDQKIVDNIVAKHNDKEYAKHSLKIKDMRFIYYEQITELLEAIEANETIKNLVKAFYGVIKLKNKPDKSKLEFTLDCLVEAKEMNHSDVASLFCYPDKLGAKGTNIFYEDIVFQGKLEENLPKMLMESLEYLDELHCGPKSTMLHFISYIVSLLESKTWKGVLSATNLYYGTFIAKGARYEASEVLKDYLYSINHQGAAEEAAEVAKMKLSVDEEKQKEEEELESEELNFFSVAWGSIKGIIKSVLTEIHKFVFNIIGEMILGTAWVALSGVTLTQFLMDIRKQCNKTIIKSVGDYFCHGILGFVEKLKDCYKLGNLTPLYSPLDNPIRFLKDVQGLVDFYPQLILAEKGTYNEKEFEDYVRKGLLPQGIVKPIGGEDMAMLVLSLYQQGIRLTDIYRNSDLKRDISEACKKLSALQVANSISSSVMALRVQPFGIALVGQPGVGKSNLGPEIFRMFQRKLNLPVDPTYSYNMVLGNNFHDGLGPRQTCVIMDDVDQDVSPPARGQTNHALMVLSLVNNAPCPIDQAQVELKGKICTKPLYVMYVSNYEDYQMKDFCKCMDAIYRRLGVRIICKPKIEYSKDNIHLDKELLQTCQDGNFMEFGVDRYDPTVTVGPSYRRVMTTSNKSELFKYLQIEFDKHMIEQQELLKRAASHNGYCSVCMRDMPKQGFCCIPQGIEDEEENKQSKVLLTLSATAIAMLSYTVYRKVQQYDYVLKELVNKATGVLNKANETLDYYTYHFISAAERIRRAQIKFENLMKVKIQKKHIALLAGISGVALALYKWSTAKTIELQGRENNALPGFVNTAWTRPSVVINNPGIPIFKKATWTLDDVKQQIDAAMVVVKGSVTVSGLIIGVDCILTNFHALPKFEETFKVIYEGVTIKVTYCNLTVVHLGHDCAIVKVNGLPCPHSIFKKFMNTEDYQVSQYDEVRYYRPGKELIAGTNRVQKRTYGTIIESDMPTIEGDCGGAWLVRLNKGWYIAGIHSGIQKYLAAPNPSYCETITQYKLRSVMDRIMCVPQGCKIPLLQTSLNLEAQKYEQYGRKSEVNALKVDHGVQCRDFGYAKPNIHGSSIVSKCTNTLYKDDFSDLTEKYCGSVDAFQIPKFGGKMIEQDGKQVWISNYTHGFNKIDRESMYSHYHLMLATIDVCRSIYDVDLDGFNEISLNEAIVGVSGSVIQSVNMNTSVGPPYNQTKKNFIQVYPDQVLVTERFKEQVEEFRQVLVEGDIPVSIGICTLKDEPITKEKNELFKARTFTNLTAALNINKKAKLAGYECAIRAYVDESECSVGINMTDPMEITALVNLLQEVDPELVRMMDADYASMDKSLRGEVMHCVAIRVGCVLYAMGQNPMDGYNLTMSTPNTIYVVKNDHICLGGMNNSGDDKTVEQNSEANKLIVRYSYYKQKYPTISEDLKNQIEEYVAGILTHWCSKVFEEEKSILCFRLHCRLRVYGDDLIMTVSEKCQFFKPETLALDANDLGMKMTDGRKRDKIQFCTLEDVQYLKRTIVYNEETGMYFGKLSMKSICKSLSIAKNSTLSVKDHNSTILSDNMREMVFHGREEYEYLLQRCKDVAVKYNLVGNSYLKLYPFDYYWKQVLNKTFSSWGQTSFEAEELKNNLEQQFAIDEITVSDNIEFQGANFSSVRILSVICLHYILQILLLLLIMLSKSINEPFNSVSGTIRDGLKSIDIWEEDIEYQGDGDAVSAMNVISESVGAQVPFELGSRETDTTLVTVGKDLTKPLGRLPQVDLGDYPKRLTYLTNWTMDTTDTASLTASKFDMYPWNSYLADTYIANKVSTFMYIRSGMKIHFTVNVPVGCYGAYYLVACPEAGSVELLQKFEPTLNRVECLPHVLIDCSNSTEGILELPYVNMFDYATIKPQTSLGGTSCIQGDWRLYLFCLQPIDAANFVGTPVGNIRIFACCSDDVQLTIPCHQGAKEVAFTDRLAKVPLIGRLAKPLAAGMALTETVMDYFGFTRTSDPKEPRTVVTRPWSNVANFDGNDTSEIAAYSVGNSITIDPSVLLDEHIDNTSFDYLSQHWIRIAQFDWQQTRIVGELLGNIGVSPYVTMLNSDNNLEFTVGGYLSLPFCYWRADMEYKVHIPVSKFHRGILQVSWAAMEHLAVAEVTNIHFNHIMDISADNTFIFRVNYVNSRPYLTITQHFAGETNIALDEVNGTLHFRVIAPLVAPITTKNTKIHVYARVCSGASYGMTRDSGLARNNLNAHVPFNYGISYQGAGAVGDGSLETKTVELVPPQQHFNYEDICLGEKICSVRALCQKPWTVPQIAKVFGSTTVNNAVIMHLPYVQTYNGTVYESYDATAGIGSGCFHLAAHYMCGYLGVASSVRYKIAAGDSGEYVVAVGPMGLAARNISVTEKNTFMFSNVSPVMTVQNNVACEVTVPYFFSGKYLPTFGVITTPTILNSNREGRLNQIFVQSHDETLTEGVSHKVAAYTSLGPDCRFMCWRFFPKVNLKPGLSQATWRYAYKAPPAFAAEEIPENEKTVSNLTETSDKGDNYKTLDSTYQKNDSLAQNENLELGSDSQVDVTLLHNFDDFSFKN